MHKLTFVGHLDHPVQSLEMWCLETKNHRKIVKLKTRKKMRETGVPQQVLSENLKSERN